MNAVMIGGLLLALTACGQAALVSQPSAAPSASAITAAEQGKALFQNKGCITCHINDRVNGGRREFTMDGIPNLTAYRNDPAFLRRWLADPQAVKPGASMPNLRLQPDEIESLIAFLNEPR